MTTKRPVPPRRPAPPVPPVGLSSEPAAVATPHPDEAGTAAAEEAASGAEELTPSPYGERFNLEGVTVPLYRRTGEEALGGVPRIDPNYQFRDHLVREISWAIWPHDMGAPTPCMIVGPKGSGKTSIVMQIAAHCGIPVMRINCNSGTTVRHLKGRVGAQDGSTVFVPGVVTQAMETGAWLLLDEVSALPPPVSLALFPILEPDGEVLLEDAQPPRYVKRHPNFRVFATDNTIGTMQESSRFAYSGTNPEANEALLDRFGSTVEVDYLPPVAEHALAKALAPGIENDDLEAIIRTARNVRSGGSIAFSTRMVIDWARRIGAGRLQADGRTKGCDDTLIKEAAASAFLNRMRTRTERQEVEEVMQRLFKFE